jgi:regulatory protein YycI of two-component signal transduction system YycFG
MESFIIIFIVIIIFLVKSFKYFSKRVSPSEKKGEREES